MTYNDDECWHDLEGHLDRFIHEAKVEVEKFRSTTGRSRLLDDIETSALATAIGLLGQILEERADHAAAQARIAAADAQVRFMDNQQLGHRAAVLRGFAEWSTRLVAGVPVEEVHRRANRALGAFDGSAPVTGERYPSFPPTLYPAPPAEEEK